MVKFWENNNHILDTQKIQTFEGHIIVVFSMTLILPLTLLQKVMIGLNEFMYVGRAWPKEEVIDHTLDA